MKVSTPLFLLLLPMFLTSGCGDNKAPGKLSDSGEFSYDYSITVNGVTCSTGKRTFNTRQEMCEGLKNDALNNNCAEELRKGYFEKHCSDFSWE
ncbi:MAG: hypothetical protein A3F16_04875 [Deltaproteobacteria bacterium RIFCSPHIGHO2_12_FULL_43_9]|nr:MAG: hypothetical protein A3F16_04875 [Deltaproteobacteria bacterium RIFCSPHIGHO2_12_FULL_43_9]